MIEVKNKYRRKFTPLNLSYSLVCLDKHSPLMQTTDGVNFYPDRKVVASLIQPQINVTTKDGSWDSSRSNTFLDNMIWWVNENDTWKKITDVESWKGLYEIDKTGTISRGTLTVKKNIGANDKCQLYFEADLLDYRLNDAPNHIITEAITLATVTKGADTWGVSIGVEDTITYNPALDKLSLYEYLVANGLKDASPSEREDCFDGNQYLYEIPIDVFKAKNKVKEGFTLELYRVDSKGVQTKIAASAKTTPNEVTSFSKEKLVLDLRQIQKNDYIIKVVVEKKVVSQYQFSANRVNPVFSYDFFNVSGISYKQSERRNRILIQVNNKLIQYPQRFLILKWKTIAYDRNNVGQEKQWQEGEGCYYNVEETGLGDTDGCELEETVGIDYKEPLSYAVGSDGSYLTDKDGNPYLIG